MYDEIGKKIGKKIINGGHYYILFDFRLLKKSYCCKCGEKLVIKKAKYLTLMKEFTWVEAKHNTEYLYFCSKCNYFIDYKNQKIISKYQRDYNRIELENSEQLILKHKMNFAKIDGKIILSKNDKLIL